MPVSESSRIGGILIRPALTVPVELYGPERRAELLLSNAVDEDDYRRAQIVRDWGLDPAEIPHRRPGDS